LGWAVITHPFHPRRGQRFRVLKARRYCGQATLILAGGECGTFSILEDWTDKAAPASTGVAHLLSVPSLLELVDLVRQWQARGEPARPAPAKQKGVDKCL
jgi:hypothetical protein